MADPVRLSDAIADGTNWQAEAGILLEDLSEVLSESRHREVLDVVKDMRGDHGPSADRAVVAFLRVELNGADTPPVTYPCGSCLHLKGWVKRADGYRPCDMCRPEQYALWKEGHLGHAGKGCQRCEKILVQVVGPIEHKTRLGVGPTFEGPESFID